MCDKQRKEIRQALGTRCPCHLLFLPLFLHQNLETCYGLPMTLGTTVPGFQTQGLYKSPSTICIQMQNFKNKFLGRFFLQITSYSLSNTLFKLIKTLILWFHWHSLSTFLQISFNLQVSPSNLVIYFIAQVHALNYGFWC